MNVLPEIIALMSKEEARNYKIFAQRTNAGTERKDIRLFDYYRKKYPNFEEDKIAETLYGQEEKNSFYRLKNRLQEDICHSLLQLHANIDENVIAHNSYLLSRYFSAKKNWKICLHYLLKAEKKAISLEDYQLLDIIYSEIIKISQEHMEVNPGPYIERRAENREKLNTLQQIDDTLATISYSIRTSQTFSGSDNTIHQLLKNIMDTFQLKKDLKNNPSFRFKIYHVVSKILLQQQNFQDLEEYLLNTYQEFMAAGWFNKNNHETKLQMLTYICNAFNKNEKLKDCLMYADKLKEAMLDFDKQWHDKYLFFHYNIIVHNYGKTNVDKAIEILEQAKDEPPIRKQPVYLGFVYLNLSVLHFARKEFRNALKSIVKLYTLDEFKLLDAHFRFKIAMVELLIRYELNDHDYVLSSIKQLRKNFGEILTEETQQRENALLEMMKEIIENNAWKKNKALLRKIAEFCDEKSKQENEIVDYGNWLKEKTNFQSLRT